jgi:hypothetical protein
MDNSILPTQLAAPGHSSSAAIDESDQQKDDLRTLVQGKFTGGHRSLQASQVSTAGRNRSGHDRTRCVIALTRDLHVFASRIATRCSAVFFTIRHNAEAWYVCAHLLSSIRRDCHILVCHYLRPFSDHEALPALDVALSLHRSEGVLRESTRASEFRQLRHTGYMHAAVQTSTCP